MLAKTAPLISQVINYLIAEKGRGWWRVITSTIKTEALTAFGVYLLNFS